MTSLFYLWRDKNDIIMHSWSWIGRPTSMVYIQLHKWRLCHSSPEQSSLSLTSHSISLWPMFQAKWDLSGAWMKVPNGKCTLAGFLFLCLTWQILIHFLYGFSFLVSWGVICICLMGLITRVSVSSFTIKYTHFHISLLYDALLNA